MFLTSEALYFNGGTRNISLKLAKIFKFDFSRRGITIQPKSGKVQFYKFALTSAFLAMLALMMDEPNREVVKRIA